MDRDFIRPHDLSVETCVLGCILHGDGGEQIAYDQVKVSDFYDRNNQIIFSAVRDLVRDGAPVDLVTVKVAAEARGGFPKDYNLALALTQIMDSEASSVNLEFHISILKDISHRRAVIKIADNMTKAALDRSQKTDSVSNKAQEYLAAIATEKSGVGFEHIGKTIPEVLEELEKSVRPEQLNTGFLTLDSTEGLYRPGSYNIIAGTPGTGKTSFVLNIVLNQLKLRHPVALMSLDDSTKNIFRRLVALHAGEPLAYDEQPSEYLCEKALEFDNFPLYVDANIQGVSSLAASCRLLYAKYQPKLFVVDYLQLVMADESDEVQRIASISRGLRALAKQLETVFIITSQFSREGAKAAGRPHMYHLKGSSQIEQDADSIIIMHQQDGQIGDSPQSARLITFYLDKNKNGSTGKVEMNFQPNIYKFSEGKGYQHG